MNARIPSGDAPMPGLKDRVALVTGATRGLGLAIARKLCASGCRVVLNHRGPEADAEPVLRVAGGAARHRRDGPGGRGPARRDDGRAAHRGRAARAAGRAGAQRGLLAPDARGQGGSGAATRRPVGRADPAAVRRPAAARADAGRPAGWWRCPAPAPARWCRAATSAPGRQGRAGESGALSGGGAGAAAASRSTRSPPPRSTRGRRPPTPEMRSDPRLAYAGRSAHRTRRTSRTRWRCCAPTRRRGFTARRGVDGGFSLRPDGSERVGKDDAPCR